MCVNCSFFNGVLFCAIRASVELVPIPIVYPSGAEAATRRMPIVPCCSDNVLDHDLDALLPKQRIKCSSCDIVGPPCIPRNDQSHLALGIR